MPRSRVVPQIALVDELAHTNAPGSRHPKRWHDVQELLDAGIEVHTTLNVQHVESRADTVQQVTGTEIRETVPDSVLDDAVLELVDLPPAELVQRLHEGKVYLPDRAAAAAQKFFPAKPTSPRCANCHCVSLPTMWAKVRANSAARNPGPALGRPTIVCWSPSAQAPCPSR